MADIQEQLDILKRELDDLKSLYHKDTYSDLEVKNKKILFNGHIGFYKKEPIAQPTTSIAESIFVENLGGTAINVDSTFDGYTLQQIVKSLRNLGLIT